jgi:hypothetical protein
MSSRALNPMPTWGAIAKEQVRSVALLQRRDFAVLGALCAGLLAVVALAYRQLPPTLEDIGDMPITPIFPALALPLGCIAVLWPLGVWRRQDPARRGYFWSLPVAQEWHTLLRVAIGWALLMAVCIAVMALAIGIAVPLDARYDETRMSLAQWWVPLVIPTLPYVFVSALMVAFENPIRFAVWVAAAVWVSLIMAEFIRATGTADGPLRLLMNVGLSLGTALAAPVSAAYGDEFQNANWALHYLVWFGLGVLLLVLAAFRRQEPS